MMMAISNSAQISELMDREDTITNSATGRTNAALGVVLWAAQKATGTASTTAIRVPRVAILMVSHTGSHNSSM